MTQPLGILPFIPIVAKFAPAILSLFGGSKKNEAEAAAQQAAMFDYSQSMIQTGEGLLATDVFTPSDLTFLRGVWGQIHVAANFTDINWKAHGYPNGPALSPQGLATIKYLWPQVRSAANFNDIRWDYHAVPTDLVRAALPVPELDAAQYQLFKNNPAMASLFGSMDVGRVLVGGTVLALGLYMFSKRR